MPERDGYIPGVPCWVDTSQPDPEAAVDFYGGLFGWEFEDVMPPGSRRASTSSPGSAAATSPRSARSPRARRRWRCGTPTSGSTAPTRPRRRSATPAAASLMEPFDVMDAGRMAVFADPEGAVFCVWQAKEHKGARIVNEHGSLNFNGLNTRDAGRREALLRLGVRLGDARPRRRRRDVDAARLRRPPRARQPRPPQADGRDGRARGLRGRRREHQPDPRRPAGRRRRTGA